MNITVDGGVVASVDRSVHALASEIDARIHFELDSMQRHRSLVIEALPELSLPTRLSAQLTRF